MLLWRANQPVPADELAELVWDGVPPRGAQEATRALVMRLRRQLGSVAAARIVTRAPGYAIEVSADELDASRFEALTRRAGEAVRGRQWAQAAGIAAEGLGLWRGAPLADVPSQLLRDQWVPHLEELRMQALDWRIEADLHDSRHEQLVPELQELTARHPLREHFHGQLMLALYRCRRQAEALAAYQHARNVLVTELGVEPEPALRELHQRILSADPGLTVTAQDRPATGESQWVPPRELPPTVPDFTGRSAELQALTRLLDRPSRPGGDTIVVSVIGGTAGVGKTALAVHWAHQVTGRFPDGQLYVNLRGYDTTQPVPATDALAGFLRSLGVPGQEIPPEADQRAARYRSLLADRRLLLVLDNAMSADQVRPLLPGTPSCAVVVTSRATLAGLVARDGAARVDLDVLPLEDAVGLLRALIGARVDADPAATAELAAQCCRLPLALRVAAELAASRPAARLVSLVGELADLRTRLDLLAADEDPSTEMRAVLSWSYRHLSPAEGRAFRFIGLHPGPDIDPYAASALIGATISEGRQALGRLARASMIQPTSPDRYSMHDLLRGYARELAATQDGKDGQHAALTRLLDYYLHTAATAMDILFPAERNCRPSISRPATPVPVLASSAAARDWLDRERATLVAATDAAARDWPAHAPRLATTIARYLYNGAHFTEALTLFSHALAAARHTGDQAAEATALSQIGNIHWFQGRLQEAADNQRQALAISREAKVRSDEARILGNLALVEKDLGHYDLAACYQQDAIILLREAGDRLSEARVLGNLGLTWQEQGRYEEAADCHRQALPVFGEMSAREDEARALGRLGVIDLRLGRYQEASGYLRQALALSREAQSAIDESGILARLGEVYIGLGRHEQAIVTLEEVLAMARVADDKGLEADALNGLGEVLTRTGDADKARTHHVAALQLASEAGSPREQARAHVGLGSACQAGGDLAAARHHWQQALDRYTMIGAPEANEIRARLTAASITHI